MNQAEILTELYNRLTRMSTPGKRPLLPHLVIFGDGSGAVTDVSNRIVEEMVWNKNFENALEVTEKYADDA